MGARNQEIIQQIISKLRQKINPLKVGYGSYEIGDHITDQRIVGDPYLQDYNISVTKRAILALPILFYKNKKTKIRISKPLTIGEYRYAKNSITAYPEPGQLGIAINEASRYIIENIKASNEGDEIEQPKIQQTLKQTPKHVVYFTITTNEDKLLYTVNTNRFNFVIITEAILLVLKDLEGQKLIEIDQEVQKELNKIFKAAQDEHDKITIDDNAFVKTIVPQVEKIYDLVFDLRTIEQKIRAEEYKTKLRQHLSRQKENYRINLSRIQSEISGLVETIAQKYNRYYSIQRQQQEYENMDEQKILSPIYTLLKNKNTTILDVSTANVLQIDVLVNTLLTNIDYIAFEKGLIRAKETGSAHIISQQDPCVIKLTSLLLLNGPKYAIKVAQKVSIKQGAEDDILRVSAIQSNIYGRMSTDLTNAILMNGGIPNPHLNYYNCFGTTATELAKFGRLYETFEQYLTILITSVANLNISDLTVMNKFFEICKTLDNSLENDVETKLFVNLETGEELSIKELKETDDYQNAPTEWRELV